MLQKLNQLPINDQIVLSNLFRVNPNDPNHQKEIKDLIAYHELLKLVEQIRVIEEKMANQNAGLRSPSDLSIFRQSFEQNLKQVSFKAIQLTINLINRDISVLLSLPEDHLVTVLKPLASIQDIRPSLLSQYEAHQRLRIRDSLTNIQINTRKDQIDVLVEQSLEVLLRFCKFDLTIFRGRGSSRRYLLGQAKQRRVRHLEQHVP